MKIEKVSYGRTYPLGNYASERIDMEASIDEHDDAEDILGGLKARVEAFHRSTNPHLYNETTPTQPEVIWGEPLRNSTTQPEEKISQEQKILNLISQATSLPELQQWQILAKSKKELADAYQQKLNELSK